MRRVGVLSVQDAESAFAALSSKIRNRFDNDAALLLAFMQDPANEKEAQELGLAPQANPVPKPEPKPDPAPKPPECR